MFLSYKLPCSQWLGKTGSTHTSLHSSGNRGKTRKTTIQSPLCRLVIKPAPEGIRNTFSSVIKLTGRISTCCLINTCSLINTSHCFPSLSPAEDGRIHKTILNIHTVHHMGNHPCPTAAPGGISLVLRGGTCSAPCSPSYSMLCSEATPTSPAASVETLGAPPQDN